jgi:hypothetical protein
MSYAADSLIKVIENVKGQKLRKVQVAGYEVAREPRDTDNDVEKPMNLVFPLKSEILAYPVWEIDTMNEYYRPMVLAVADSYYWNIFNTRIPKHVFANEAFWFFNSKVYPDTYFSPTWVKNLDLKKEIEEKDVIFLMVTERFMHKFDWQFIDMVYDLYTPTWLLNPVYRNMNRVVNNDELFAKLIKQAGQDSIPLEEVIRQEAMYIYYTEDKSHYLIDNGVEYFKKMIREDSGWYAHVTMKADEHGILAEEQLKKDAEYTFNQNYPELYEIYLGIQNLIQGMKSHLDDLDILQSEANAFGCGLDDYLPEKAFTLFKEQEIQRTEQAIRNTPDWMADVRKKAEEQGTPLDTMIRRDAEYVWEQRLN